MSLLSAKLSSLDDVAKLLFQYHPGCLRCGAVEKRPSYADDIGMTPVCEKCWNTLEPEGRFQWVLLLMASWAQDYRKSPISYSPPHSQARYRDWTLKLENARRVIFEGSGETCPLPWIDS